MMYLLTFNHQQYVVKMDVGVSAIIKTLSSANPVERDRRWEDKGIQLSGKSVEFRLEPLNGFRYVKWQPDVLDPEVLPPSRGELAHATRRQTLKQATVRGELNA